MTEAINYSRKLDDLREKEEWEYKKTIETLDNQINH